MRKKAFYLFLLIILVSCSKTKNIESTKIDVIQEPKTEVVQSVEEVLFKCWINSSEGLQLRSSPSLDSKKISLIEDKKEINVFEIGQLDEIDGILSFWLRVEYNSNKGWIFGGYTSIVPPIIKQNIDEPELEIRPENLWGTWYSGYLDFPEYIEQSSFFVSFDSNGNYQCGKNFTSIGTKGKYTVENDKIILNCILNEDPDQLEYNEIQKINKLTETCLIYLKGNSDNSEEISVYRYPKSALKLFNESEINWIKYINVYGNQKFYNDTDLFMSSIVNKKYDVALLLLSSLETIEKSSSLQFDFLDILNTEQDLNIRKSQIYQYLLNNLEFTENLEKLNLEHQYEMGNRTVKEFKNSLKEEKYFNSFKIITSSLWDMNDYILKNNDFSNDKYSNSYKMNYIIACNTAFVNNELLIYSPLKIGMSKKDVYELLGHPERSFIENELEIIDYWKSLYMGEHDKVGECFYASVGIEIHFDENKVINEICLIVEGIDEPVSYYFESE